MRAICQLCLYFLSLFLPSLPLTALGADLIGSCLIVHDNPETRLPLQLYPVAASTARNYRSFLSFGSGWNLYCSSSAGCLFPFQQDLSDPKCLIFGRLQES